MASTAGPHASVAILARSSAVGWGVLRAAGSGTGTASAEGTSSHVAGSSFHVASVILAVPSVVGGGMASAVAPHASVAILARSSALGWGVLNAAGSSVEVGRGMV